MNSGPGQADPRQPPAALRPLRHAALRALRDPGRHDACRPRRARRDVRAAADLPVLLRRLRRPRRRAARRVRARRAGRAAGGVRALRRRRPPDPAWPRGCARATCRWPRRTRTGSGAPRAACARSARSPRPCRARRRALGATPPGQLQAVRAQLVDYVAAERRQGRLLVTPEQPTPLGWWLAQPGARRRDPAPRLAGAAVPAALCAAVHLATAPPRAQRPGDRAGARRRPRRRARHLRGSRHHQRVHRAGQRQAGPLPPHAGRSSWWPCSTTPRATSTAAAISRACRRSTSRAGCSSTTSSACSSPATTTASWRATWTTSSTRWPGA